jgi:hypothetical protein
VRRELSEVVPQRRRSCFLLIIFKKFDAPVLFGGMIPAGPSNDRSRPRADTSELSARDPELAVNGLTAFGERSVRCGHPLASSGSSFQLK